ncbi:MAG TPA: hypothetical protein VHA30_01395 [Patescibacteria group bacterium]|nr:hypothetical protein [Patescibacteria group bacterium]
MRAAAGIAVFVALGIGIFSMAAMNHAGIDQGCMPAMSHAASCPAPQPPAPCLAFHYSILEKFSQSVPLHSALEFLSRIAVLGAVLSAAFALAAEAGCALRGLKARLRRLRENITAIFWETAGRWLSIFEKRDPAGAFAQA